MKKLINQISKTENKILLLILGILGFSTSCVPFVAEYGCPQAEFILTGKVKSAVNQQAIKNIQVVMAYDTVYTDENGNYKVQTENYPEYDKFTVYFNDIDSTQNGHFKNKETDVNFSSEDLSGGDGNWDEGTAEKVLNVNLDEFQND